MQSHEEAAGVVVVTYDSTKFVKWLLAIAVLFVGTAVYDAFLGSRGTDRLVGLLGGAGTCGLAGLALLEKNRFRFDPVARAIAWDRRWGFRRRMGTTSFDDVRAIMVEVPIGDTGIPSRRICLHLVDGSLLPLAVGYKPDVDDGIVRLASRLREVVGHPANPSSSSSAQVLVDAGRTVDAIRLLIEADGLSLGDAKRRVEELRTKAAPHVRQGP